MILPPKRGRPFQGPKIRYILNHTNDSCIAARVTANTTGIMIVPIAAIVASNHRFSRRFQSVNQGQHETFAAFQQMQNGPPCRSRAQPWQAGQVTHQVINIAIAHQSKPGGS
jgi:hypothetical protein